LTLGREFVVSGFARGTTEPGPEWTSLRVMDAAVHCRTRAKHARQLAETTLDHSLHDALLAMAQDYDELAEDLEHGAEAVRHPELLPEAATTL